MDETVSGTFGGVLARLDQWSTWGKFALAGLALAFMKLNWWLLVAAFDKHSPTKDRQRAGVWLAVIWAVTLTVIGATSA